ncbi:bifunctional aspartate transaminase/aspartate 4-decarboxylase [Ligilactobacillus sp. LYQ135]
MDADQKKALEKLGAFEISSLMLKLAKKNNRKFLNAGKGNPNWINKKARLAFNRFTEFGIKESERTINRGDLVGYIEKKGIYKQLVKFIDPEKSATDAFIKDILHYVENDLQLDLDDFVAEVTNGVIGNTYPTPNRILKNAEIILNKYLESTLYNGVKLANSTELFATEGGTAAIVYLFHSLAENHLINPGDKIAINTPIFTPYLQIPKLNDYELVEVKLQANPNKNWNVDPEELDKLKDPSIKALFIVNPTNPASRAFGDDVLVKIKEVVTANPDLMIITDDVYGTFVDEFQSVYSIAPKNTLLIYSFSKLYGATGWRLGLLAMNKDNIFDRLICQLPTEEKKEVNKRYSLVNTTPEKLPFIERVAADSRSIGLYHTSGLSTPQQMMEVLFALTHLVYAIGSTDQYIDESRYVVNKRYSDLITGLGIEPDNSRTNAKYYTLIDIYKLAEEKYGKKFRKYFEKSFAQIDFLTKLSENNGVVLMDGVGFGTQPGIIRVSEANLPSKAYLRIAQKINEVLEEYYTRYLNSENK